MTRLVYIANARIPTEKAHGLQIMQNCEAFAEAGAQVSLWLPNRINPAARRGFDDPWAYYGVRPIFALRRVPCLDLLPLVRDRTDAPARLIFHLQQASFTLAALLLALAARADVYYSRLPLALLALSLVKPRRKLVYEAHALAAGRGGRWLQRRVVRRVGLVVAVTARLAADLARQAGENPASSRLMVAHDGIQQARFAALPDQAAARAALNWPQRAFIVGYIGRLHTMAMDKGVGTLVEALRQVEGAALGLAGGPDDMAEALRRQWLEAGLPQDRFLYAGQVPPGQIPLILSAFDVCVSPLPWTPHFAFHASPIKLFEYMASGRPIIASDLPSAAEVLTDGESALLFPPADAGALAAAIIRLRDDPALRARLAQTAREMVMARYTWAARARAISEQIATIQSEEPQRR